MGGRVLIVSFSLAWVTRPLVVLANAAGQAVTGQDGYVPIAALPPAQQLPAAPFLIGAYAFIWVVLLGYLWSISRRLGRVQQEIHVLKVRAGRGDAA
jgi:CcmD family protein